MEQPESWQRKLLRPLALTFSGLLTLPLIVSCSSGSSYAPPPANDGRYGTQYPPSQSQARRYPPNQTQVNRGLSNRQKVAILAGAAALYYLYNQRKNAQGQGPEGQYYMSKNGRVYYRDAQGRPHWVSPPPEGIQVPEEQAARYRDFQGYNGRTTGRDLTDIAPLEARRDREGSYNEAPAY